MENIIDKKSFDSQTILLVEDYEDDVMIMRHALQKAGALNPLQVVNDGEQAMAYLSGLAPFNDPKKFPLPIIVFLDLSMPKKNGLEVLQWAREQPKLKKLTIHILTASNRDADVERAAELGANAYLVKPGRMQDLIEMLQDWRAFSRFAAYPNPN